jgi:hypothetical protein
MRQLAIAALTPFHSPQPSVTDMKIIDPSLCPDDFGPVLFEHVDDDPRGPDVFAVMVDGASVGELAPLRFNHLEMIVLDEQDTCVVPYAGCWSLELTGQDGRLVGTHVLFPAQQDASGSEPLAGELAVWAALVVISTFSWRDSQRG